MTGCYEEVYDDMYAGIDLWRKLGDRWGMGTAYHHMSMARLRQGNPTEALSLI